MIKFNKNNKLIKIHQKINKTKLKFPKKIKNFRNIKLHQDLDQNKIFMINELMELFKKNNVDNHLIIMKSINNEYIVRRNITMDTLDTIPIKRP